MGLLQRRTLGPEFYSSKALAETLKNWHRGSGIFPNPTRNCRIMRFGGLSGMKM